MESSKTYRFDIDYGVRTLSHAGTAMPAKLDLRGSTHMSNGEMVVTKAIAAQLERAKEKAIEDAIYKSISGANFTQTIYDEWSSIDADKIRDMMDMMEQFNERHRAEEERRRRVKVAPETNHPAYGLF